MTEAAKDRWTWRVAGAALALLVLVANLYLWFVASFSCVVENQSRSHQDFCAGVWPDLPALGVVALVAGCAVAAATGRPLAYWGGLALAVLAMLVPSAVSAAY